MSKSVKKDRDKSQVGKKSTNNLHIYISSLLTQKIVLNYNEVNSGLFDTLESKLKQFNEGKCIKDGYVNDIKDFWSCDVVVRSRVNNDDTLLFLREIEEAQVVKDII